MGGAACGGCLMTSAGSLPAARRRRCVLMRGQRRLSALLLPWLWVSPAQANPVATVPLAPWGDAGNPMAAPRASAPGPAAEVLPAAPRQVATTPASTPTGSETSTPAAPQGSSPAPPGPAGAATAPSPPDWPTLAQMLALPGWLNLTLTVNAAPIANPIGGLSTAANWMQQNELNLNVGTGLALEPSRWRGELDHWQARLRLDLYNGQPTFASAIGSLFEPQTMAYTPGLYLSGVSVSRSSRDQSLQISAGFQSIDHDFLVAPPFTAYLYSGFNDTLNLTIPGLPITPFAAPSVLLHWRSPGFGRWSFGAYWLDQETELAGLFGAPPALSQDLRGNLQVLQWDLPLWNRDTALKLPITQSGGETVERQLPAPLLQIGAFRNSTRFFDPADSPTGRSTLMNHVVYGSLTLPARLPLGLDNRFWGTLQWGLNPSQNITPLFLAGGWQCQGPFPGRPMDVLSLGLGRTGFSPQLQPGLSWAGALELNYNIQVNNRLSLQPVLQWLPRPSGEGTVPAIITTALQLNLSL
jgi:porin